MSDTNDNLVKDLNQIKQEQVKILDAIDRIKEKYEGDELADIEKIEKDAWTTVLDIDEINKQRGADLQALIERNTILFRMQPRNPDQKPERVGNIRF